MRKATSLYLDCLRVIAAMVVFAGHCVQNWYPTHTFGWFTAGHDAVVVFFVLSGYVIAYSTLSKGRGAKSYVLARLSRLYSVVVPALVLTAALLIVGRQINPVFHDELSRGYEGVRFALSSVFLQEAWSHSSSPPNNAPLWSLGYEFWYYAIFGAAVFLTSKRSRTVVILILCAIVGYKVLLLMPIWLLGVALYRYSDRIPLSPGVAKVGFVASLAAFFSIALFVPDLPVHHGFAPLYYSGAFITDFASGLCLAATIACFDQAFGNSTPPVRFEKGVRWIADHTFSLYLYHFPLVVAATACIGFDHSSVWQTGLVVIGILLIILILSTFTESKRRAWHQAFAWLWDRWAPRFRRLRSEPVPVR